jgi:transcription elongation factor Elf1
VPEVTCPNCQTRQEVGDAEGYTCVSCGAAWAFAACENCGVRFHMRPGTTAWTCPECGHENGTAEMVDLGSEPAAETASDAAPAPTEAAPPPRPAAAGATRERSSGPPTRARLATLAVIGIVAVLVIAFALSAFGGTGEEAATGTQTPSIVSSTPAPSSSLTPTEQLCLHLQDVQLLRVDNYTRLAAELADDEAAIQASGDAKLAAAVDRMRTAVIAYKDALAAQADMTAVTAQMGKAYGAMPCT